MKVPKERRARKETKDSTQTFLVLKETRDRRGIPEPKELLETKVLLVIKAHKEKKEKRVRRDASVNRATKDKKVTKV